MPNPADWDGGMVPPVDQLRRPEGLLGRGLQRFAMQPMPGPAGQVRDALIMRQLRLADDSGSVELGADGRARLQPARQIWNLEVAPDFVRLGFDTRQRQGVGDVGVAAGSGMTPEASVESALRRHSGDLAEPDRTVSPARRYLEDEQRRYVAANPDWWRP